MCEYKYLTQYTSDWDKIADVEKQIKAGGEEFSEWCKKVLCAHIAKSDVNIMGGTIIPQMGKDAGEFFNFLIECQKGFSRIDSEKIEKVTRGFLLKSSTFTEIYELKIDAEHKLLHLCIITPIRLRLDRPIGCFWAIISPENEAKNYSVKESLARASDFVAAFVCREKALLALEGLARATWTFGLSSDSIVKHIVESCMSALVCSAVIVWEKQGNLLKTIVALGSGFEKLEVDLPLGVGIVGKCALDSRVILIEDLLNLKELRSWGIKNVNHPDIVSRYGWRTAVFVPLDVGGENIGVLAVFNTKVKGFNILDTNIAIAFAQRISSAHMQAKRLEQLDELDRRISLELPAIEAGMLAFGRVHDIVNRLNFAQNYLSLIANSYSSNIKHPTYRYALNASKHIDSSLKKTKTIVRRSKIDLQVYSKCNLKKLLDDVVESLQQKASEIKAVIEVHCSNSLVIEIDQEQIERVFFNLLENSLYWLEVDRKGVRKKTDVRVKAEKDFIVIEIEDNGPGIAPHDLPKIFDYFYTTRGERGMGFGLPLAKRIVEAHGGKIKVDSRWGYKTLFTISLPISKSHGIPR